MSDITFLSETMTLDNKNKLMDSRNNVYESGEVFEIVHLDYEDETDDNMPTIIKDNDCPSMGSN